MSIQGKGFYIWNITNCEKGDVNDIAAEAAEAKITHVLVKIADGVTDANVEKESKKDRVPDLISALRHHGISQVWGWHYVYGYDPLGEAKKATQRLKDLDLDGYVVDAEIEYSQWGRSAVAEKFMRQMRSNFKDLPIALSSYRYPTYHATFPWETFLTYCDYNMPQVYWEQSHNPETQLKRCLHEFQDISPFRPLIPTAPTYKVNGWVPSEKDIQSFLETAVELNLAGANFFSWDECRRDLPRLWEVIQGFDYNDPDAHKDAPQLLIEALNAHNPAKAAALYTEDAVHVTAARTLQGTAALTNWYENLLQQILPNATFTLTGAKATGTTRTFTWQAAGNQTKVTNGSDTVGIIDGKIKYHYSYFTVTH